MPKSSSLGTKLLIPFVIIALASATGALVSASFTYISQLEFTRTIQVDIADRVTLRVENFLGNIIATLDQEAAYLAQHAEAEGELDTDLLLTLSRQNPTWLTLAVLDTDGQTLLAVRDETLITQDQPDFSTLPAIDQALENETIAFSLLEGADSLPDRLTLVVPARNAGNVDYLLVAQLSMDSIQSLVADVTASTFTACGGPCQASIYLLDAEGQLLGFDSQLLLASLDPPYTPAEQPVPAVRLTTVQETRPPLFNYSSRHPLTQQEMRVFGLSQHIAPLDWVVLVERPRAVVLADFYTFMLLSALMFAIVTLGVVGTWSLINRRLVLPINQLRDGVATLAQGEFDKYIQVDSEDEIGYLADEFNAMSIKIFEYRQSQADIADELAELYHQEQRQTLELNVINQINHTVMASLDVESTADAVLRNLQGLVSYNAAELNIWQADSQTLRAYGVGNTTYTNSVGNLYHPNEGFTGWLYHHQRPLIAPNVADLTDVGPKNPSAFPYRSYIGVPLKVEDRFTGTLELAHSNPDTYTESDLQSLQRIARQAAIAIEHANLFQKSQTTAHIQRQLAEIASLASTTLHMDDLLGQTMSKVVDALGAQKGLVFLLDEQAKTLHAHPAGLVGLNLSQKDDIRISTRSPEFAKTVLKTGRPFLSDNAQSDQRVLSFYHDFIHSHNLHTILSVPLITPERNVGEIHVANKETPFTQDDLNFLSSVAVYFATAIQNATLFETTRRNLQELSVLYQSAEDLSRSLSVEETLANLAKRMATALPTDLCVVAQYNSARNQLISFDTNTQQAIAAAVPPLKPADHQSLTEVFHIQNVEAFPSAAKALQKRKYLLLRRQEQEAKGAQVDQAELNLLLQNGYQTLLLLPLVSRDHALGLVRLYTKTDVAYTADEISLGQTLANQAAIALQNARIYEETDEQLQLRLKELSGLQSVSRELNSTLDLQTTLRLVVEEAVRATGADFGNVSLYDGELGQLTSHVKVGWPENQFDDHALPALAESTPQTDPSRGIIGRVLKTKQPEIIANITEDPDYVPQPVPVMAEMVVPIQNAEAVVGIINVQSKYVAAFTEDQLKYIQALAEQAAVAIRNAQAYAVQVEERRKAGRRINQLSKLSEISRAFRANLALDSMLEEIAFAIQETVGFNVVLLSVVEHGWLHRRTGAGIPLTLMNDLRNRPVAVSDVQKLMQTEFQLGESYFVPAEDSKVWQSEIDIIPGEATFVRSRALENAWQNEDLLFTPLRNAEGSLIGLLSVDGPNDGHRPNRMIVTTLEIFANQAATAIENTNLFSAVQRQATQLRLLSQISARISAILNPAELLGEVVTLIADSFNYYHVRIYQMAAHYNLLVPESSAGTAPNSPALAKHAPSLTLADKTLISWAAQNQQAVIVNDVQADDRFRYDESLPHTQSELVVPLRVGNSVAGVLDIQHNHLNAFTENDLSNYQTLADQLAIAMQNARLFDESMQRERLSTALGNTGLILNETLDTREILNVICQEALAVFNVHNTALWLRENGVLYGAAAAGPGMENFVGQTVPLLDEHIFSVQVVQRRQAISINNVNRQQNQLSLVFSQQIAVRAIMGVPLIVRENTLGAIMLIDTVDPYRFDMQDKISATLLANQAAIAIENARLFEEEQRRVAEMNILNQIGQSLSSILDLPTLLEVIYKQVASLMHADNFYIALYDSAEEEISFPLARGGEAEVWHPRKMGNGLTERIIRTREPVLLNGDVEPQLQDLGVAAVGQPAASWLGVPMISGDQVLGVIALQDYVHAKAYSENDCNLLLTIAAQAAIALQNVYLLNDTQTQAQEMRQLYDLGVSVNRQLEIEPIMAAVVQEATQLINIDLGIIFVWDEYDKGYLVEETINPNGHGSDLVIDLPRPYELAEEVITKGQLIILDDLSTRPDLQKMCATSGAKAMAAIPITIAGEAIGAIFVFHLAPYRFTPHSIDLLQFVATQAAVTIRNAQLVQRLNEFNEELEQRVEHRTQELRVERDRVDTLYRIARELSASLDQERVLHQALYLIQSATQITQGSILLLDAATNKLVYRAAIGRETPLPREGLPTPYQSGYGLAGKVLNTRKALIVPDLLLDENWVSNGKEDRHRAVLAAPLISGYDMVGVLILFHSEVNYFSQDHMRLITAATPMIATAISNADLYSVITDQAERLGKAVNDVKAEARKNEAIVEGIGDGVLVLNDDYQVQLINPAAAKILGVDPKLLLEQNLSKLLTNKFATANPELLKQIYHRITKHQPDRKDDAVPDNEVDVLNLLSTTDQDSVSADFRIEVRKQVVIGFLSPIQLTPNAVPSTLVVLRDISREVELDRIKAEFVSTVSHELRTPMTSIKGYTDLLVGGKIGQLSPMQAKAIQVIKSNADRLANLVNDILDISRIDAGRVKLDLQAIEISPLIRNVLDSFVHQMQDKNLSLSTDIDVPVPPIYADPNRVTQVLVNLVGNAVKYTRPNDSVHLAIHSDGQVVQIDVQDTGLGLDPEDQKHVFDRFFRAERDADSLVDGTGLGLSIAQMFVEMMGGQIWLKSELGVGSTFSFTLPLLQATQNPHNPAAPTQHNGNGTPADHSNQPASTTIDVEK